VSSNPIAINSSVHYRDRRSSPDSWLLACRNQTRRTVTRGGRYQFDAQSCILLTGVKCIFGYSYRYNSVSGPNESSGSTIYNGGSSQPSDPRSREPQSRSLRSGHSSLQRHHLPPSLMMAPHRSSMSIEL
jgi:hypothetical protein